MSAELYGIRVLEIKPIENKVQIQIFVINYDVIYKSHQPIPKDHSFFFRVLWDKGDTRFGEGGSIGREVSVDDILNPKWVDKNTFKFIKKVERLSTANYPVEDYNIYEDIFDENETWEGENEKKLVQAIFDVWVTDKKYLDHLSAGMSWKTAAYETNSLTISHDYLEGLPDMSNLIIRLEPFKDKAQEEGTISNALFSLDNAKLFVISDAGELVCYETKNWKEEWRYDTGEWYEAIKCDNKRKLVWIDDSNVINFEGKKVSETIAPDFNCKYDNPNVILQSPSGNYYLFGEYNERVAIYTANGDFLWDYESLNEDQLYVTFFYKQEQVIIREEASGLFKIFDLKIGAELKEFTLQGSITTMAVDPTDRFLSIDNLSSNSTHIIEIAHTCSVFNFSTKYHNDDYLSACIWSLNSELVGIITKGEGKRHNDGYGGCLSIYPVGNKFYDKAK